MSHVSLIEYMENKVQYIWLLFQIDWILMYRATTGCSISVYGTWTSEVPVNTEDETFRSISIEPAGIYKAIITTDSFRTLYKGIHYQLMGLTMCKLCIF